MPIKPSLKHFYLRSIAVIVAGMLLPLAHAPFGLASLSILSPLLLFYFLSDASPRQAGWYGWCYGLGMFGVGVSWVFVAIHTFGYTPFWLAILLTFLFVAFIALFIALQGYVGAKLIQRLNNAPRWLITVWVLPGVWFLQEWFRGWFLTGFPWLNLGYAHTDSPLAGYAPLFGVYGISWLCVFTAGLLLALMRKQLRWPLPVSLILVIWLSGLLLQTEEWSEAIGKPLKVSLVQGNLPQISKWDEAQIEHRNQTYARLTREHWDSDLVLWPENALTIFYHQLREHYLAPLAAEARQHHTAIILGLPVLNREKNQYYSSLLSLQQQQFYHKSHLVPFGEYVPLESVLRGLISFFNLPMSGFSPGEKDQPALQAAGYLIAPSICYEDAFGEELIRFLPAANLLVNASNNAWYGDSFAPHQHLQISRMRALETGRDVLRVTTNGISAIIDQHGKVQGRSPQFTTYVLSGTAQPRRGATPYVNWGNYPVLWFNLSVLLGLLVYFRSRPS